MTVCYGPTTTQIIISLIVSSALAIFIGFLLFRKERKYKILWFILNIIITAGVFIAVFGILLVIFWPPCGGGLACMRPINFTYYEENDTCIEEGGVTFSTKETCMILIDCAKRQNTYRMIEDGIYTGFCVDENCGY